MPLRRTVTFTDASLEAIKQYQQNSKKPVLPTFQETVNEIIQQAIK